MRLIDADALKAKIMVEVPGFLDGGSSITKAFIMAMIGTRAACPTIDAVPVVRCKDCIHSKPHCCDDVFGNPLYDCKEQSFNQEHDVFHHGDWFCADGKMNMITVLREKRNRLWEETKMFLAEHRDENGIVPVEYMEVYDKMTADVKALGDEIKKLEDQDE